MADFASDCVWDHEGLGYTLEELPISETLRADIRAWAAWYDNECDVGMPNPRPFPRAEFGAKGLALGLRLKI